MDVTLWMGIAFFLLGVERFIPNIHPQIAGAILIVLGLIILIPALA